MASGERDRTEVGVVLLHGSELGSWAWEPVMERLRRPAIAVDLPGRAAAARERRRLRLVDAVDAAAGAVQRWDRRPVVVVAHSFSGVLVPGLLERLGEQVRAVVWLAATVPAAGRSWLDVQSPPQRQVLRLLYRLRPSGMRSPRKASLKLLCSGLDEATASSVVDRLVTEPPGFLLDPVPPALPTDIPSHYVRLLADLALPPQTCEASVQRLTDPHLHVLDSGHLPMLSHPQQLAALVEQVASSHERERAEGTAPPVPSGRTARPEADQRD